jgi:2-C-methyl-D-erythritol 4-phosphate cytidylyltransferase
MGFDKLFAELAGKPVLLHTLAAFQEADYIDHIVVVCSNAAAIKRVKVFAAEISKIVKIVKGGETRAESVRNGINAITHECDIVLIHDGARPLVTTELIRRVADNTRKRNSAVPVIPLTDTIKRVKDHFVVQTVNRDELYAAQTPQGFRLELYRELLEQSEQFFGSDFTDDGIIFEKSNIPLFTVDGEKRNIKITTPTDLKIAEVLFHEPD